MGASKQTLSNMSVLSIGRKSFKSQGLVFCDALVKMFSLLRLEMEAGWVR
jgi:hypothetical protein